MTKADNSNHTVHRALDRIHELIGQEVVVDEIPKRLNQAAREIHAPAIGAMLVTCSDESEQEVADAFHRFFVQHHTPRLKFGSHAAFRSANLGARYEWGSIRLAEDHFATEATTDKFKVLVVKINSHVSHHKDVDSTRYGSLVRYGRHSDCCGALAQLLAGKDTATARDLTTVFTSEADRLSIIRKSDPELRLLLAALVNARLQARKAMVDAQDHLATTPTIYVILPCVTVNRPARDTEILCGVYCGDTRDFPPTYRGLEARPEEWQLTRQLDRVRIAFENKDRPARDHRRMLLENLEVGPPPPHPVIEKARNAYASHPNLKAVAPLMLKGMVLALAEVAPVPAALLLFGEGLIDIHHLFQMENLNKEVAADAKARKLLKTLEGQLESLPPEQAEKVLHVLMQHYG